jgi:predicted nucleic acid-binding protein
VVTRQQIWGKALTPTEAAADAATFAARFSLIEDGPAFWDRLIELCRRYSFGGRQVHDANVVTTMLAYGERRLLMFNEADFRRFAALIEVVAP